MIFQAAGALPRFGRKKARDCFQLSDGRLSIAANLATVPSQTPAMRDELATLQSQN